MHSKATGAATARRLRPHRRRGDPLQAGDRALRGRRVETNRDGNRASSGRRPPWTSSLISDPSRPAARTCSAQPRLRCARPAADGCEGAGTTSCRCCRARDAPAPRGGCGDTRPRLRAPRRGPHRGSVRARRTAHASRAHLSTMRPSRPLIRSKSYCGDRVGLAGSSSDTTPDTVLRHTCPRHRLPYAVTSGDMHDVKFRERRMEDRGPIEALESRHLLELRHGRRPGNTHPGGRRCR